MKHDIIKSQNKICICNNNSNSTMERQGKETRFSRRKKLLENKALEDKNSKTDEQSETLKTVVTHQSDTPEEKCDKRN